MASSPLTKGLVAGKTTGILGAGMTTNPALDNSTGAQRAKAELNNHNTRGRRELPPRSGPAQPSNRAVGRKLTGGATIRGGVL